MSRTNIISELDSTSKDILSDTVAESGGRIYLQRGGKTQWLHKLQEQEYVRKTACIHFNITILAWNLCGAYVLWQLRDFQALICCHLI